MAVARPLPDSYRRLSQYAMRLAPGAMVYEQDAVPNHCYVVLRGTIQFEALDAGGEPAVVASAREGDLVGHVAAFTGRPTSAAARAAGETIILAVPMADLLGAFREAPELALQLIRAFANHDATPPLLRAAEPETPEGLTASPAEPPPAEQSPADPPPAVGDNPRVPIEGEFDPEFFFVDSITCPVSGTEFDYLRVRTRSVRPVSRDSDFFVRYRSLDPAHYSILVCPSCGYAAYRDDFQDISEQERALLWEARETRLAIMEHSLTGLRPAGDAVRVADLALHSYALRRANERRRAVLLHRRAWIERERGDADAEREFLTGARDAYRSAYERDSAISEESAMRAAYLIGDLTLRLGDPLEGSRWLETATRSPEAKQQSGLARMARERLYDARRLLDEKKLQRPA